MTTTAQRKSSKPGEQDAPRIERVNSTWRIRSTEGVRQVLRGKDATLQAGFSVEDLPPAAKQKNPPILFMDGERHRQQRSKVARYFAPKTVSTKYRELMESRADELVAEMIAARHVRLDQVTMRYSVEVAAHVIGLTNSPIKAMAKRLERFFDQPVGEASTVPSRFLAIQRAMKQNLPMFAFYVRDVRPAIQARRKQPQEDVISHLIAEGYDDSAILIECVTYGAAGMITTREFISMAVWHLLENPPLRDRYLVAGEAERHAILLEVLRLEPIVGHLYRRAQVDFEITDAGATHCIAKGDLLDLYVRQANADPTVVGVDPLGVCPGRPLPRGIGEEVVSFGDGAHKCPGNSLAIQEADILLQRLLAQRVAIVRTPTIGWDELISGYSLRDFVLRVGR